MYNKKLIRGIARFSTDYDPHKDTFPFLVETDDNIIHAIATKDTVCDCVLSADTDYIFKLSYVNGENLVLSINERFDHLSPLTDFLEQCITSGQEDETYLGFAIEYIDKQIFRLEVSSKFEDDDCFLVWGKVTGKLFTEKEEDKLIHANIISEGETLHCIIDKALVENAENIYRHKEGSEVTLEGVFTPQGFYAYIS